MKEKIKDDDDRFKVDLIIKINSDIYIFEMKYRRDRLEQEDDAIRCIYFCKYTERCLNYLKKEKLKCFLEIKEVHLIGLAINGSENFDV